MLDFYRKPHLRKGVKLTLCGEQLMISYGHLKIQLVIEDHTKLSPLSDIIDVLNKDGDINVLIKSLNKEEKKDRLEQLQTLLNIFDENFLLYEGENLLCGVQTGQSFILDLENFYYNDLLQSAP